MSEEDGQEFITILQMTGPRLDFVHALCMGPGEISCSSDPQHGKNLFTANTVTCLLHVEASQHVSCSSDGSWTLSDCKPITCGSFSSPSNGVASATTAFIDGVVHVSFCGLSASQGIEITSTPTCHPVSCGMPPCVLNAIEPSSHRGHIRRCGDVHS